MSTLLVEVINLNKNYGSNQVIKNLSVKITTGVTILKGLNGSGKSTFIKLLLNLETPSSGKIIRNYDSFSYVPELLQIKSDVKVKDYLKSVLALKKLKKDNYLESYLELELEKPLSSLSKGNLKKVLLYLALVGRPDLIFLDEPLDGLDLKMKEKVVSYLNKEKLNFVISLHYLEDFINLSEVIEFV